MSHISRKRNYRRFISPHLWMRPLLNVQLFWKAWIQAWGWALLLNRWLGPTTQKTHTMSPMNKCDVEGLAILSDIQVPLMNFPFGGFFSGVTGIVAVSQTQTGIRACEMAFSASINSYNGSNSPLGYILDCCCAWTLGYLSQFWQRMAVRIAEDYTRRLASSGFLVCTPGNESETMKLWNLLTCDVQANIGAVVDL